MQAAVLADRRAEGRESRIRVQETVGVLVAREDDAVGLGRRVVKDDPIAVNEIDPLGQAVAVLAAPDILPPVPVADQPVMDIVIRHHRRLRAERAHARSHRHQEFFHEFLSCSLPSHRQMSVV